MKDGNLQYALLGLLACRAEGAHGYQLKRELEALCEDAWSVSYGRVYHTLQTLEEHGFLVAENAIQTGRPNRRVYRLTDTGTATVENWIGRPVAENAFPLRDETAFKLLFIDRQDLPKVAGLVAAQRSVCITKLRRVGRRHTILQKAGFDEIAARLVVEIAEARVRAELQWLEKVERAILKNSSA